MTTVSTTADTPLDVRTDPGRPPRLVLADPPADPEAWVAGHREGLRAAAVTHGALRVRGLGLADADAAARVVRRLADRLVDDREAFAPRGSVAGDLYTSATWPAQQPMCMHHELSYRSPVPSLVLVACLAAPDEGGTTGVADAAAVLADLPADLIDRFERVGWQLVRTYGEDIGASVADAFGTDDPAAVERYCAEHDLACRWLPDGGLRTVQRRPAVVRHPVTGRRVWLNQVAFLSEWTLDEEVRDFLVDSYGEDGLPFTTRFGDGEPIGPEIVARVNEVYDRHARREPWQAGDLLLIDNLGTAHDRQAYRGRRDMVVGLADPVTLEHPAW